MNDNREVRKKLYLVAAVFGSGMILSIAAATAASARSVDSGLGVAVLLLGGLAAVATYMDVDVEAAIGLSGNTMILTATIVVFRPERFYVGVALVAILGALDYTQVRRREFFKIVINAGV